MLVILLLIPIFCISMSIFIMNLINFIILNELDILLFTGTIFINIISSFFILKLFIKNNEESAFFMNLDQNFSIVYGFFSFCLMFIFGLFLIINSVVNEINIYYLSIGIILVVFFIFLTFMYFIKQEKRELILSNIDEFNESLNLLSFKSDDYLYKIYVSKKEEYIENKKYLCLINKSTNRIKKIKKEID